MVPSAFGTFNEYFVKKRTLMMGIAQTLTGLVIMIYPILVNFLMETYGFQGGSAILAAINLHVVLGMLLMHPVKWHYKIIQVPEEESRPCMPKFYLLSILTIS